MDGAHVYCFLAGMFAGVTAQNILTFFFTWMDSP